MTLSTLTRRELLGATAAIGASVAFPAGAAPAAAAPAGDAAADTLLKSIVDRLLAEYPENATYYGIDKGEYASLRSQLTDRSGYGDRARATWAEGTLARLKAVDRKALSPAKAIDVDVTQEVFELAVAGWKFPSGDMAVLSGQNSFRNTPFVFSQLSGSFVDVPDFLESKHMVSSVEDAQAYVARLEVYAADLDYGRQRYAEEMARGTMIPDFILDTMFTQRILASLEPPEKWGIVTSFADKCAKAGVGDRYAAQAAAVTAQKVQPALDRQMDALRTARPKAWSEPGVWKQPQGEEWYAWALRAATTTTATADEIHAQGLEQAARLQSEMDVLLKAQGLTQGSVGERMIALGKRPDLLYANDDAGRARLLEYLNTVITDIRGRMPKAFTNLVKGNLVIKRVPPAIEEGAPNGYAAAGSIDGSLPGNYYINLKDTGIWPRYSLPTLCFHEGIPGHIWQGEYANRMPLIRTHLAFNAYSEGWGLYAEQLGDELGFYDGDPLGKLGYLQSINFRACRLVVDTGLHAKRWTMDQALSWFRANTGMTDAQLKSELVRYCAMPGQACGYKMGHNKINMLRLKAQTELGPRYDFRKYNDAVVEGGNVPLTLLERIVDRHIAATRA